MAETEILEAFKNFLEKHGREKAFLPLMDVFNIALYDSQTDINQDDKDAVFFN